MAVSRIFYLFSVIAAAVALPATDMLSGSVAPIPDQYAASIVSKPDNASSFYGGNASFYCSVTGDQGQFETFQWRKMSPGPPTILTNNEVSLNTSKYIVTERYRLTIVDVREEDDGEYACAMNLVAHSAYLVCIAAPQNVEMYWTSKVWGGQRSWAETGREINLNCDVEASRPKPEIRWYKGAIEMTSQAIDQQPKLNATGYAHMTSSLALNLTKSDEGALFKCVVHLPGSPEIAKSEMRVAFSSATAVTGGLMTMLSFLLSALINSRH